MIKIFKILSIRAWMTVMFIFALAYNPYLLAQSPIVETTNVQSQEESELQVEPSTDNTGNSTQSSVEKAVEDPGSLLENEYVDKYGLLLLAGILGAIIVAVILIILRTKIKQAKDLKHHTAQPFGHVSAHATKKAKKNNPDSQVVAPGGASPAPQQKIDMPEVNQEVINKKEITVKESEPKPPTKSVAQQPEQLQSTTPKAESPPPQQPTQSQPITPPQTQVPQQSQPSGVNTIPTEDPSKPVIIVGDAIEDD